MTAPEDARVAPPDPADRTHPPTPAVSIVIPCYVGTPKQAELLDETLHTVAAQTCRDFEVIVVDDGSPRDVSAITARHAGTITLAQANAGSAIARNTGIRASRGRYFVFLDADDHLLPQALEAGLRAFEEHPECGFVIGRREEMTYEGTPVPWGVASLPRETWLYDILLGFDWYIIPPSSAMFRREAVEAVGGFRDPWGADDLDFYLRVARAYPAWCYEEPAVTRYRRYSASSSRDGERMLRSIRAVYARQWPLVQGNPAAEAAFDRGLAALTKIFVDCLAENFSDGVRARNWRRVLRTGFLFASEKGRAALGVRSWRPPRPSTPVPSAGTPVSAGREAHPGLERVRTLPIYASDDQIRELVVDWSELLAEKRFAEALSAFPHSTQEYDWTPDLLERVIDGYGVVDPDPDVLQDMREDHGVERFEVSTLRGRPDRDQLVERSIDVDPRRMDGDDELGWVHYQDVPLNGFLSDLTARFIIRRVGTDRLTLEFYDLHVM